MMIIIIVIIYLFIYSIKFYLFSAYNVAFFKAALLDERQNKEKIQTTTIYAAKLRLYYFLLK